MIDHQTTHAPGCWDWGPKIYECVESSYGGMTLRDYFAAKFAAAMMTATSADRDYPNIDYQQDAGGPTVAERVATIAYRMADAMLRAREASND